MDEQCTDVQRMKDNFFFSCFSSANLREGCRKKNAAKVWSFTKPSAKNLALMLFWSLLPILAILGYFGCFGLIWPFWAILDVLGYFVVFDYFELLGLFFLFWPFWVNLSTLGYLGCFGLF